MSKDLIELITKTYSHKELIKKYIEHVEIIAKKDAIIEMLTFQQKPQIIDVEIDVEITKEDE